MIEVNASITAYQRQSITVESQLQRNAVAFRGGSGNSDSPLLNAQQNQIVDDVGISPEAIQKLEQARVLENQLRQYLNYLKGEAPQNVLLVEANDNSEGARIDARSESLSASISYTETTATQTNISARFTDEGELVDLAIDQIRVSEKSISVELQSQILDLSIQA